MFSDPAKMLPDLLAKRPKLRIDLFAFFKAPVDQISDISLQLLCNALFRRNLIADLLCLVDLLRALSQFFRRLRQGLTQFFKNLFP